MDHIRGLLALLPVLLLTGCEAFKKPGCGSDRDCKGDRVCEARRCVQRQPCPEPAPCPRPECPACPACPSSGSESDSVQPDQPAERPQESSGSQRPRIVAGGPEVRGSLSKEIIRRIIRRHLNEVKYCYQSGLAKSPDLSGQVVVQFTIGATGQVVVSKVQSSTLKSPAVESCITAAVRRWLFPKPLGGGIVIVSYPFVLKAAG